MSQKVSKPKQNRSFSKIYKWILIVLIVTILEIGGIFAAIKLSESESNEQISNIVAQLSNQDSRISMLEKLPNIISDNTQQLSTMSSVVSLLGDNINIIKNDLSNNKLENIDKEIAQLSHKMESIEETKNNEALILSIALLIKENALYNRKFAQEVNILTELSANQENIQSAVSTLNELKNTSIINGYVLAEEYKSFADNLNFEEEPQNNSTVPNTKVSKSIKLIKDTVAGINFDKVIVIKKDKRTAEQKLLIDTLNSFVKNHNYIEAIAFIEKNPEFSKIENKDFINWIEKAKNMILFDKAVSNIITTELSAIRKDIVSQE